MLSFYAPHLSQIQKNLGYFVATLAAKGQVASWKEFGETLGSLERVSRELGLKSVVAQVERTKNALRQNVDNALLLTLVMELQNRITDELKMQTVLMIPFDKQEYYEQKEPPFGKGVQEAFPSAVYDIEEASKCYALGRNTACVFHLVRVLEIGLRRLGRSLNDPRLDPATNPNWEKILKRCDEELAKPIAQRSDGWRQDNTFFSEAAANLRAVKNAWRNPSVHAGRVYDEEQARDVFNALGGFMRHLAAKLRE